MCLVALRPVALLLTLENILALSAQVIHIKCLITQTLVHQVFGICSLIELNSVALHRPIKNILAFKMLFFKLYEQNHLYVQYVLILLIEKRLIEKLLNVFLDLFLLNFLSNSPITSKRSLSDFCNIVIK